MDPAASAAPPGPRPLEEVPLRAPPLRPRALLPALAALAVAACDRAPEAVIVPEYEFAFSFETGLSGWVPASADLGAGSATVTAAQDQASEGSRSVRLDMDNVAGSGKVWMTRELEVTPDQRYGVEVVFDLGTSDHGTVEPWQLIAGVRSEAPSGPDALDVGGSTASGAETAEGYVWTEKGLTLTTQADEEGRLYVTLGVRGATVGSRTYWIDNVRLVLTRI